MSKQKRKVGSIVKIKIGDGYHTYARVLDKASIAVYDCKTNKNISSLEEIILKPILFIVAIYNDVITKGRWEIVGIIPLEESLKELPMQFIQDKLNPKHFELYNPNTGIITPATLEQCLHLERAAVWEAEHVEERIRDYYDGKPSIWVENLKIKDIRIN